MKIAKKILLILSISILGFVVVLAAAGLWVFKNPAQAWIIVQNNFLPKDLKITWQQIEFRADHISKLNFNVKFRLHNLYVVKSVPNLQIPITDINVDVTINPISDNHKIILHDLHIDTKKPVIIQSSQKENPNPTNPFGTLHSVLQKVEQMFAIVKVKQFLISIDDIQLTDEKTGTTKVTLNLQKKENSLNDTINLNTTVRLPIPAEINIVGDLQLQDSKILLSSRLAVQGFGIDTTQNISGTLGANTSIQTSGELRYKKEKLNLFASPKLDLQINSDSADIKLQSTLRGLPGKYLDVHNVTASFHSPLRDGQIAASEKSTFSINAPLLLFPLEKRMRSQIEVSCDCKLPEVLKFEAKGTVWMANLSKNSSEKVPIIDLDFTTENLNNKLFDLALTGTVKIDSQNQKKIIIPNIFLDAKLHQFRAVAKILDSYRILIPSPFDVLGGSVHIKTNGPVEITESTYNLPVVTDVKLISAQQQVDVNLASLVQLDKQFKSAHIELKIDINKIRLQLPPLNPAKGNPRVVVDSRILVKPPKPKKLGAFKFTIQLAVTTKQPGAIQLLSGYFDPHLPLTVNIEQSENKQRSGELNISTFEVSYLRRKLKVDKLAISFSEANDKVLLVAGRFSVQQTRYKIFIDVNGLLNKPNIILSSEPELPRSEIINVLIYDRTSDGLVSPDLKTSGQVESAVADRAIGLFGIWAFASTPIKGFSYNPSTKVYVATVQLADDLTASIGTTWESATQLELQKRVSRNWILTAAWTPTDQNEVDSSKLLLQWEKRFEN